MICTTWMSSSGAEQIERPGNDAITAVAVSGK